MIGFLGFFFNYHNLYKNQFLFHKTVDVVLTIWPLTENFDLKTRLLTAVRILPVEPGLALPTSKLVKCQGPGVK